MKVAAQVMHNLVINADHAMPRGGTISLRCENCTFKDNEAPSVASGKYVRIIVRDTGMGIPKDHLLKIFDPYFTTKQKGSGLGLATVYSVIQKHGGAYLQSQCSGPERPSPFCCRHPKPPCCRRSPGKTMFPRARGKSSSWTTKRTSVKRPAMCLNGWVTARHMRRSGESALKLYREALQAGDPFRAVIMDLTIPGGMGGAETLQILRELDPNVKGIVSSGYSNDPVMAEYGKYGFVGVVANHTASGN